MICDECGTELHDTSYDSDEWDVMMADSRAEGWRAQKIGGEWCHYCSDCQ